MMDGEAASPAWRSSETKSISFVLYPGVSALAMFDADSFCRKLTRSIYLLILPAIGSSIDGSPHARWQPELFTAPTKSYCRRRRNRPCNTAALDRDLRKDV